METLPHHDEPAEPRVRLLLVEGWARRGPVELGTHGRGSFAEWLKPDDFKNPPDGEEALGLFDDPKF